MRSRDEFQSKAFRTLKAFLEGTPVPVVEHGGVLVEGRRRIGGGLTTRGVSVIRFANGFGARATDGGLRPPTAISVEPNGIPTRPTDDVEPIPVGDEADAAPAIGVLALPAQAPEVPPDRPPPSNSVVEPEVPAVDIPVLKELPGIEGPCQETPAKANLRRRNMSQPIAGNVPDVIGPHSYEPYARGGDSGLRHVMAAGMSPLSK